MSISRRAFLKTAAVAGAATAAAALGGCARTTEPPDPNVRWGMVIDLRRCFGCHACSVACKAQFDVPLGVWRSWVRVGEEGKYPNVTRRFLPLLCNQCDNTPCLKVCPTSAIYRRADGILRQIYERCIGCRYCIQACPYKMRFVHPINKIADKCDFCVDRVDQGLLPSCVETCNGKARIFGNLKDPNSEISRLIASEPVTPLRPEMGTAPKVFYIGLDEAIYSPRTATLDV